MKNRSPSGDHHAAETRIHQKGMHNRSPEASDASTRYSGPSVNKDAVRQGTSATPKTLGPREA